MSRLILSFVVIVYLATGSNHLHAQELAIPHWNADAKKNIFKDGKFDDAGNLKVPKGWRDLSAFDSGNAALNSGGRRGLSLNSQNDEADVFIEAQIDVPSSAKYLTFIVKQRGPTLVRTSQPESGAGVRFTLIQGSTELNVKRVEPGYEGYRNWSNQFRTVQVMPGENKLVIRVEVTKATGSLEVDSIIVVPSDITREPTNEQRRLLNQALANDDPELIQQIMDAAPHLLETRTGQYDNGTPLTGSAWIGAPKVAAMLVKLGADIEAKDTNWGNTPLRWCCWWGSPDVAEVLLEAGAEANGASGMARSSKTSNTFTKRPPEDFDRTAKIIDEHVEKRKSKK